MDVEKTLQKIFEKIVADGLESSLEIDCPVCRLSFGWHSPIQLNIKTEYGIISNAHGIVRGWKFRVNCPRCKTLLRFDEDEIFMTARAIPANCHN